MTYQAKKVQLQKDLYIKRSLSISDSVTPWSPKTDITLNSIKCELKSTATGAGNSIIRIWENRGASNQNIIFDASFAANQAVKETVSSFAYAVTAGAEITYSIIQTTATDPGGEAIISFLYENT
jgi:hypothetical protein